MPWQPVVDRPCREPINYLTGHAVFEATHGTAPRFAYEYHNLPQSYKGVLMRKWMAGCAELITNA